MEPLSLFVAAAILAFTSTSVNAAKDKVKVLQFADPYCNGHPIGKPFEMKRDECKTVHASSIRLQRPHKDKYLKGWIGQINKGHWECYISYFNQPGCPADSSESVDADHHVHHVPIPADFEKCTRAFDFDALNQHPPRSIKFSCGAPDRFGRVHNETLSVPVASWSIQPHGTATASIYTTTVTAPRWEYPATSAHLALQPRAEQTVESRVVHGRHHNKKGVWLKHPWGGGEECFECWTKKSSLTSDFKCQAGPDTNVACGKRPSIDHNNAKYWTTPTVISTVTHNLVVNTSTSTQTLQTLQIVVPAPTPGLQERSQKKSVKFEHPFIPGHEICAKAKWHHAGERKQRVDIKGPKDCHEHHPEKDWPVDIKYTATVSSLTTTVTNTVTHVHSVIFTQPVSTVILTTTLS